MSGTDEMVREMASYLKSSRLPVRVSLNIDTGYEVSVQRLATRPDCRRQGYASQALAELVRLADLHDVVLGLEALPEEHEEDGGIGLAALAGIYRKFGFEGDCDPGAESVWMYRSPRVRPVPRA